MFGCAKSDAAKTRAYWADVKRCSISVLGISSQQAFNAADQLDRLPTEGVDPKVVAYAREASAFYRRYRSIMHDAEWSDRYGSKPLTNEGDIKGIANEAAKLNAKASEIGTYMSQKYGY